MVVINHIRNIDFQLDTRALIYITIITTIAAIVAIISLIQKSKLITVNFLQVFVFFLLQETRISYSRNFFYVCSRSSANFLCAINCYLNDYQNSGNYQQSARKKKQPLWTTNVYQLVSKINKKVEETIKNKKS